MTHAPRAGRPQADDDASGPEAHGQTAALGRLAAGVAHDFNNLLTVILTSLDLLEFGDEAERIACVTQMREAAESGARLTRQLLNFGRPSAADLIVFNLNGLIGGFSALLERLIEERIQVVFHLDKTLMNIEGDPGQFEQLVLNLALNARDAIPSSGRIAISTRNLQLRHPRDGMAAGPYVVLAVQDDGVGMDAATQAQVFEPFFTTKGQVGTGLGLTTVHAITRNHAGHVRLQSAPGGGTIFEIYLPATTAAAPVPAAMPAVAAAGPSAVRPDAATILVVEDDARVKAALQRTLRGEGYRVLTAATPAEVVCAVQETAGAIDLLITDMVMPQMDGASLARRLKHRRSQLEVICMSGYGDALKRPKVPGAHYLAKPFHDRALVAMVETILDGRSGPDRSGPPQARSGTAASS